MASTRDAALIDEESDQAAAGPDPLQVHVRVTHAPASLDDGASDYDPELWSASPTEF